MKCGWGKCDKEASQIIYWPRETTYQCDEHTLKIKAIGKTMGHTVRSAPIEVKEVK